MKTIRLTTCDDSFQAHLIQGALENEGIPSLLHNDNTSNILRGLTPVISGVDILVRADDYGKAMDILRRNQMVPEDLKYCPHCHSPHIRLVRRKGQGMRAFFAALFSILAVAPPGTAHWEYVCRDCGTRFEKPVARGKEYGE